MANLNILSTTTETRIRAWSIRDVLILPLLFSLTLGLTCRSASAKLREDYITRHPARPTEITLKSARQPDFVSPFIFGETNQTSNGTVGKSNVTIGKEKDAPKADQLVIHIDKANGYAIGIPYYLFSSVRTENSDQFSLSSVDNHSTLDLVISRAVKFEKSIFLTRKSVKFEKLAKLSYSKISSGWYVMSGTNSDGSIFYEFATRLTNALCEECVITLDLRYPVSERLALDKAIPQMTQVLRATADTDYGYLIAIREIAAKKDVAKWQRKSLAHHEMVFGKRRFTPHIAAEDRDVGAPCSYQVHVYEEVRDSASDSHSATFERYDVDVCRNAVLIGQGG